MKFHITAIRPPGFLHTSGFNEIIDSLSWSLSELGHQVVIAENTFSQDSTNILFGAELLSPEQSLPGNVVIYNLEQGALHPAWENIKRLAKGKVVWDYNKQNVKQWLADGYNAIHLPFAYTPNLSKIPKLEHRPCDVFFSGWMTPRRLQIMQSLTARDLRVIAVDSAYGGARDQAISTAKVCLNMNHDGRTLFNAQRVSYLLANSKCVVSETSSDDADYAYLDSAIIRVPYEQIVEKCVELCSTKPQLPQETRYRDMEQIGFDVFSAHEYTPLVADALKRLPQPNPILARYERGCLEGDMREYLPWLRANAKGMCLEIGTRDGASTAAILLGLDNTTGVLTSVDISDGPAWEHPHWVFLKKDSRKLVIGDGELDFILIDGDHSREGFLADLHNCYRWAKSGAMIACHDTHPSRTVESHGGDFPSVAVGQEFRKFVAERGLTSFELGGEYGMSVMVVKK